MKKTIYSIFLAATALAAAGCADEVNPITNPPVYNEPIVIEHGGFARGADVSWLTQYEAEGYTFQNQEGVAKELMTLLRDDCGVDAIRLRVWVDPSVVHDDVNVEGWCNTDDLIIKARRANNLGLRTMIDFHFSDVWADPGKQYIPEAWKDMTLDQVLVAMAGHVTDVLSKLKALDIEPEWVQIGNETRTSMMWPLGTADNFSQMVNAGYDAVKAVFPDCQVIVHCDSGDNLYLYNRLFGRLKADGARYDMIGMSLYPTVDNWEKSVTDCLANVKTLEATYGKPVMLCEIGFDYKEADIADQMMRKVVTEGITAGLKGVFWWEPEAVIEKGYTKGCFDATGTPTKALDIFKELDK